MKGETMQTPSQRLEAFDVCESRHQGNEQSITANQVVNKDRDRAYILKFFQTHETGYLKQIARVMGKQLNQISGRISELKADNLITDTGKRMEGCTVYKLKNEWELF